MLNGERDRGRGPGLRPRGGRARVGRPDADRPGGRGACRARPTGSARSARSRSPSAYVAAGRLDAMLSARGCRSVDAAAAQLIVREAGARGRVRRARARARQRSTSTPATGCRRRSTPRCSRPRSKRRPGRGEELSRMAGLVDWGLARSVAMRMSGEDETGDGSIDPTSPTDACDEALDAGARIHRARADRADPAAGADRPAASGSTPRWPTLEEMAEPLERAAAESVQLPGLLGSAARRALGAAAGVEAGVISGYASSKVLGQFDIALTTRPRPSRLLLVEPERRRDREGARGRPGAIPALDRDPRADPHGPVHRGALVARRISAELLGELLEASGAGLDPKAIARARQATAHQRSARIAAGRPARRAGAGARRAGATGPVRPAAGDDGRHRGLRRARDGRGRRR